MLCYHLNRSTGGNHLIEPFWAKLALMGKKPEEGDNSGLIITYVMWALHVVAVN